MKYYLFRVLLVFLFLPLIGFAQSVDYEIGSLEITPLGSDTTLYMGRHAEIARFRVSNRSDKNLIFESMDLRNYGTADMTKSFENVMVYVHNENVGQASFVDRRALGLVFDDFILERGRSVILTVKADLVYAKSGQTVQLGVRREEDVLARDYSSGFYATCEDCAQTRFKTYTLRAGSIYLQRNSSRYRRYRGSSSRLTPTYSASRRNYPTVRSNQSYSPRSRDVIFFSSFFRTKVGIEAEGVFLPVSSGSQVFDKNGNGQGNEMDDFSQTFSDFRLYVGGEYVDHANEFEYRNGELGLLFDTSFLITPNSQLLLTGRLTHEAVSGDKVRFRLDRDGLIDPVYVYNYDSVSPSGGSFGNYTETKSKIRIYK